MGKVAQGARAEVDEKAQLRDQILRLVEKYADLAHPPRKLSATAPSVPVSGKVYGAKELRLLVDASLDFWLTTGRFNLAFEEGLQSFLDVRYALTCNSGSSANLLAVSALCSPMIANPMHEGDEVITCATGFPTTINPIFQNNLVPVFVDVHVPTYNILAERIEAAVTSRTRAIMIAHTLGNPFDLQTVLDVAKRHDLFVIEDTCDALGATYNNKMVGTFGDVGTLSFYPAHHITMGEGGAVFTRKSMIKRALESVRDWGRDCWCETGKDNTCAKRFGWQLGDLPFGYDHKFTYSNIGYNLKITDMQAAVGLAQLDRLPAFINQRRANYKFLRAELAHLEEYLVLPEATPNSNPSWFGLPLTVKASAPFSRTELVTHLNSKGIATRNIFAGNLTRQPYMKGRSFRIVGDLANSDTVMNSSFWIGVYPGLRDEDLAYMVDTMSKFCRSGRF